MRINFARIFANAVARRIAFVLVAALLAWCGIGQVHAGTPITICGTKYAYGSPSSDSHVEEKEAREHCTDEPSQGVTFNGGTVYGVYDLSRGCDRSAPTSTTINKKYTRTEATINSATCVTGGGGSPGHVMSSNGHNFTVPCENGVDPATGLCIPSPEECLAHNAEPGFLGVGDVAKPWRETCLAGCQYKLVGAGTSTTVNGQELVVGEFEFTGNLCGLPASPPPPAPLPNNQQECVAAGAGQTFCVKPDGQQCYSASTGRQICWSPSETGNKSDGNVDQQRDAGLSPQPPRTVPPPGEELGTPQPPIPNTTVTPGGTVITTVVVTTPTVNGTSPGSPPGGETPPSGEQPPPGEGEGDDDEEGTSTGGGDCDTPPVSTGDPILSNVLTQAWHTRCNVAKANAVTGSGECEEADYECSAEQALCHIAREAKRARCEAQELGEANEAANAAAAAESDGLEGLEEGSIFGAPNGAIGSINSALFGGGEVATCAFTPLTLGGQAFMPWGGDAWLLVALIKWLFVACAYVWAAYLVFR